MNSQSGLVRPLFIFYIHLSLPRLQLSLLWCCCYSPAVNAWKMRCWVFASMSKPKMMAMSLLLLHRTFVRCQVRFYLLWSRKGREVAGSRRYVCVANGVGILTIVCFVGLLLKSNKLHSQMLSGWEMRSHCLRVICWYITFAWIPGMLCFLRKKKSASKSYWWLRVTVSAEVASTRVWKLGKNSSNLEFCHNFKPVKDFREVHWILSEWLERVVSRTIKK